MKILERTEGSRSVRREQLTLLSLLFRYVAWLFWLGAAGLIAVVAVLLYESATVTARLLRGE